jgi:hypothetical protein
VHAQKYYEFLRMFLNLIYFPVVDVRKNFELIKEKSKVLGDKNVDLFINYFENTFIEC